MNLQTDTLTGLKDPEKSIEHEAPSLIQFYADAMTLWSEMVQDALFHDQQQHPAALRKQAIVRGFPGGHEDCFNQHEPTKVEVGYKNVKYNWPWISVMNERFQEVAKNYLDIHYLGIDAAARLRPDAVSGGRLMSIVCVVLIGGRSRIAHGVGLPALRDGDGCRGGVDALHLELHHGPCGTRSLGRDAQEHRLMIYYGHLRHHFLLGRIMGYVLNVCATKQHVYLGACYFICSTLAVCTGRLYRSSLKAAANRYCSFDAKATFMFSL